MHLTDFAPAGGSAAATPSAPPSPSVPVSEHGYRSLAAFRHHMRRFLAFSEQATGAAGVSPVQYQAMLAIKAHEGEAAMSLSQLAERLVIRLNSAVELVGRLGAAGLVKRSAAPSDRRRIELRLTSKGETLLASLASLHLAQHQTLLPDLLNAIAGLGG